MNIYKSRVERVTVEMEKCGLGQLMVTDPVSICYLTGIEIHPFERFWAFLIRTWSENILFANQLFALGDTGYETVTMTDSDEIAKIVSPHIAPGKLGIDKTMQARLLLPLIQDCPDTKFVLGADCVDNVRAIKDKTEQELMRKASKINDDCMEELINFIHEGATEKECASYLVDLYKAHGADDVSFNPIISFGANAADPHHSPDDTVLKNGDCIVMDIGCKKDGYCSDMTRTCFWKKADQKYVDIYDIVLRANQMSEDMIREGIPLCEIDATARNHISAAGYGQFFTHRLGHFIGIEEHEKGDVSSANSENAKAGMIFSIEPGVYLPNEFGVRIEDLVIVTEDGCEVLNKVDKNIRILGI